MRICCGIPPHITWCWAWFWHWFNISKHLLSVTNKSAKVCAPFEPQYHKYYMFHYILWRVWKAVCCQDPALLCYCSAVLLSKPCVSASSQCCQQKTDHTCHFIYWGYCHEKQQKNLLVLNFSVNLRYLYFTWVFSFHGTLHFYSITPWWEL